MDSANQINGQVVNFPSRLSSPEVAASPRCRARRRKHRAHSHLFLVSILSHCLLLSLPLGITSVPQSACPLLVLHYSLIA